MFVSHTVLSNGATGGDATLAAGKAPGNPVSVEPFVSFTINFWSVDGNWYTLLVESQQLLGSNPRHSTIPATAQIY